MGTAELGIAFYLPDFNGGGAERNVLNIVRNWPANHSSPVVIVRAGSGALREEFETSARVVDLGMPGRGGHRPAATYKLARAIDDAGLNCLVAALSPVSAAAARSLSRQRPLFAAWIQNPPDLSSSGMRRHIRRSAVQLALRRADLVFAISPGLAAWAMQRGCQRARVHTLPNSIDLKRWSANDHSLSDHDSFRVVIAARLCAQKRIDIALRAFARADIPHSELVVAGEGHELEPLRKLVQQLDLSRRVKFLGFIHDLPRLFGQCDCLLLTSDYEGFGNVIVEALASGLRIVSTRAPHGPEFILNTGELGALCECGDVTCLARELESVARTPDSVAQREARVRRAHEFDARVVAERLVHLVSEPLRNR